ncbi:AAA family ATPase [Streptomyces monticola]|uniref:AAA family ATPase n=1 Tax=Streptomyces monticola TaxID=2666263 RepID=A0ABW2JUW4_9ACTN
MTAPHTPPHQPSANDPWPAPPHAGAAPPAFEEDGPDMKTELREAAVIAVAVAVSGALLGLLWGWLAPHVPLVSDGKAVFLKDTEGEQAIGADGTFILLALAFGAVSALVVFLVRKRGGVPLAVALMLGGLLASVVAWRLGILFGPGDDVVARAKAAGPGVPFDAPLKLTAMGALIAWPIAALAVHLGLTALFGPRDPEFDPAAPPVWQQADGAPQ